MVNFHDIVGKAIPLVKPLYKPSATVRKEFIEEGKTVNIPKEDKFASIKRNSDKNRVGCTAYGVGAVTPLSLGIPIAVGKIVRKFKSHQVDSALLKRAAELKKNPALKQGYQPYVGEIGSRISEKTAKKVVTDMNVKTQQQLDKQYRDLLDRESNKLFKYFKKDPQKRVYEAGFNPSGRKVLTVKTTRQEAETLMNENSLLGTFKQSP